MGLEQLRVISAYEEAILREAAEIHSVSWRESHRAFCPPDFVAAHTPERQYGYLRSKLSGGSRVYVLLREDIPVGLVTVTDSLIADLYILPEERNRGYGSHLLRYAMGLCPGTPTLWILENNRGAERLYRRHGFIPTGRVLEHPGGFAEREFSRP